MENEGSLTFSQGRVTELYIEARESTWHTLLP
jgi:hypothetical protein